MGRPDAQAGKDVAEAHLAEEVPSKGLTLEMSGLPKAGPIDREVGDSIVMRTLLQMVQAAFWEF